MKVVSISLALVVQLQLYHVTGPDGQPIEISPDAVVSLRPPRGTDHFNKGTNCLIFTNDGKFTATVETCPVVQTILQGHVPPIILPPENK